MTHSILLVAPKSSAPTSQILGQLCKHLPVVKIERGEELDRHGWMKTLMLVQLSDEDFTTQEELSITLGDDWEGFSIEFRVIQLSEDETPRSFSSTTPPVAAVTKLAISTNYGKPRIFSGDPSRAKDEDTFPVWLTQARALLEEVESEIPEVEKRRRIREALKTPALDLIEYLRRDSPKATAKDYLEVLEIAFGSTLSGGGSYTINS